MLHFRFLRLQKKIKSRAEHFFSSLDFELFVIGWFAEVPQLARRLMGKIGSLISDQMIVPIVRIVPYHLFYGLIPLMPARMVNKRKAFTRDLYSQLNHLMLGLPSPAKAQSRLWRRKYLLEYFLYCENLSLLSELERCAAELSTVIEAVKKNGDPIILAPLHMHSDLLAVMVCARATGDETVSVISDRHDPIKSAEDDLRLKQTAKFSIHKIDAGNLSSSSVHEALRAVRLRQRTLVAFPDPPPEVTLRLFRRSMRTISCTMFGREARLHSGVAELAKVCRATVVFWCLTRDEHGFSVEVIATSSHHEVASKLGGIVEGALRKHDSNWLFWYSPSFYFFNCAATGSL